MIATRLRRSVSRNLAVSTSSIRISPSMQANRKRAPINELLPAPVRPTIPFDLNKFRESHSDIITKKNSVCADK